MESFAAQPTSSIRCASVGFFGPTRLLHGLLSLPQIPVGSVNGTLAYKHPAARMPRDVIQFEFAQHVVKHIEPNKWSKR